MHCETGGEGYWAHVLEGLLHLGDQLGLLAARHLEERRLFQPPVHLRTCSLNLSPQTDTI